MVNLGFLSGPSGYGSAVQCRGHWFHPGPGRCPCCGKLRSRAPCCNRRRHCGESPRTAAERKRLSAATPAAREEGAPEERRLRRRAPQPEVPAAEDAHPAEDAPQPGDAPQPERSARSQRGAPRNQRGESSVTCRPGQGSLRTWPYPCGGCVCTEGVPPLGIVCALRVCVH